MASLALKFSATHRDLVHDAVFNYHGKRMATCASDHSVKVWELQEDGTWGVTATIKEHAGSIWKVDWAHPEFGQLLASCSGDGTIVIYEEQTDTSQTKDERGGWFVVQKLLDSRVSVESLEFAPKHLGLKLATCSTDGVVRIYDAPDAMQVSNWSLHEDFKVFGDGTYGSSLSWCSSRSSSLMVAVGCKSKSTTEKRHDMHIQIWETYLSRKLTLAEGIGLRVSEDVSDVAFAPSLGRKYYLLAATCSNFFRIWKLTPTNGEKRYETELELNHEHSLKFFRVSWSGTGTAVAATSSDNSILIWQADYDGKWHLMD
eukprot:m.53326 g.53326  ORF g.53326 m.53326 type:complete len:315 (+) comp10859_c0_seq1:220-1164(+)